CARDEGGYSYPFEYW
nr:immunoglobulin heavy chain junction region [Macaca mulatta]